MFSMQGDLVAALEEKVLMDIETAIAPDPSKETKRQRKRVVFLKLAQLAAAGPPAPRAPSTNENNNNKISVKHRCHMRDDEDSSDTSDDSKSSNSERETIPSFDNQSDLPVPEWIRQHPLPPELRSYIEIGVRSRRDFDTIIQEAYEYLFRIEGLRQIVNAQGECSLSLSL
jgi:hypothetical protein